MFDLPTSGIGTSSNLIEVSIYTLSERSEESIYTTPLNVKLQTFKPQLITSKTTHLPQGGGVGIFLNSDHDARTGTRLRVKYTLEVSFEPPNL